MNDNVLTRAKQVLTLLLLAFAGVTLAVQESLSPHTEMEIDKFCAKYGTNVEWCNDSGETLLHIAVMEKNIGVVRFLIEKGANINAEATGDEWTGGWNAGYTPLHYAARFNRNLEILKLLIEKGADWKLLGWSPLHVAVVKESICDVQRLLDDGENVSVQDQNGRTPLHLAVEWNNNIDIIKLLIDKGAGDNAKSVGSTTLLHIAAARRDINLDVIKLLIAKGADVNARDCYVRTPLHIAAGCGTNPDVIKVLIDNGADVNANYGAQAPLYYAASGNTNPDIIKVLIDNGADVNAKISGSLGTTPLHAAAMSNRNPDIIKLLIDKGADISAQSTYGTPLHAAVLRSNKFNNNLGVIEALIGNGADGNAKDSKGRTPLDIAKENKNTPMAVIEILSNQKRK
ncbi:MAG: ankyrin repeat domain-containing protein [Thermoguttaceae bacterium]